MSPEIRLALLMLAAWVCWGVAAVLTMVPLLAFDWPAA